VGAGVINCHNLWGGSRRESSRTAAARLDE
jgi:hypothetical protein